MAGGGAERLPADLQVEDRVMPAVLDRADRVLERVPIRVHTRRGCFPDFRRPDRRDDGGAAVFEEELDTGNELVGAEDAAVGEEEQLAAVEPVADLAGPEPVVELVADGTPHAARGRLLPGRRAEQADGRPVAVAGWRGDVPGKPSVVAARLELSPAATRARVVPTHPLRLHRLSSSAAERRVGAESALRLRSNASEFGRNAVPPPRDRRRAPAPDGILPSRRFGRMPAPAPDRPATPRRRVPLPPTEYRSTPGA